MTWLFRLGIAMAVTGAVWSLWPSQDVDLSYWPRVDERTYARSGPRVVIDTAHFNLHTARGRLQPFVRLLIRDGYRVTSSSAPFSDATLQQVDILVIANAMGLRGWLQHAANVASLERYVDLDVSAFDAGEIRAVERWVRAGGRLLLVADHAPAGEAAAPLAAVFGVEMRNWWAEDDQHHDKRSENPAFLVFTSENGLLPDTPVARGRTPAERVERVMTFTGQALAAPSAAMPLLVLSDTAREYPFRRSREQEGRPAAGLVQAVALRHGAGRVVVAGEAAMFTAQYAVAADGQRVLFGMNRMGNQNKQFVLNVMHWLSGLIE